MGTKIIKSLMISVILLLFCTFSYALDKEHPDQPLALSPTSYYTYVKVVAVGVVEGIFRDHDKTTGETRWNSRLTWFEQRGSGTVVNDQMVLTAAHVIVPQDAATPESGVSIYRSRPLKLQHHVILIFDYKEEPTIGFVHWIDEERDVALIRFVPLPNQLIKMPFDWVISRNMIDKGDAVSIIVHERDEDMSLTSDITLRNGHIVSTEPMGPSNTVIASLSVYDMVIDAVLIGGDSGSPVIGYCNGIPVLIGVARAYWTDGILFYTYFAYVGYDVKRYTEVLY